MMKPHWRPGASRYALEKRAELLTELRLFFVERGVMEVETPVLSRARNSDPNIHSIATDSHHPRFLRTSPEYPMKRLLAAGSGDIYELGRVFRSGERGKLHNPEFTMAEWYRLGMNYLELANEVVELILACGRRCSDVDFSSWPVNRFTYRQLFQQFAGTDSEHADETELMAVAAERGIVSSPLDKDEWLDLIMARVIQPALPGETFTIIYDYPPQQAALSRVRQDDPPVAERFEVFAGQFELANGYQELTDAVEQRERFEREKKLNEIRDENSAPIDENLLAALNHGMPECSGVALGVDRLLMLCLNVDDIGMVMSFPWDRA